MPVSQVPILPDRQRFPESSSQLELAKPVETQLDNTTPSPSSEKHVEGGKSSGTPAVATVASPAKVSPVPPIAPPAKPLSVAPEDGDRDEVRSMVTATALESTVPGSPEAATRSKSPTYWKLLGPMLIHMLLDLEHSYITMGPYHQSMFSKASPILQTKTGWIEVLQRSYWDVGHWCWSYFGFHVYMHVLPFSSTTLNYIIYIYIIYIYISRYIGIACLIEV